DSPPEVREECRGVVVGCVKRSADAPGRDGASALRLTHPTPYYALPSAPEVMRFAAGRRRRWHYRTFAIAATIAENVCVGAAAGAGDSATARPGPACTVSTRTVVAGADSAATSSAARWQRGCRWPDRGSPAFPQWRDRAGRGRRGQNSRRKLPSHNADACQ